MVLPVGGPYGMLGLGAAPALSELLLHARV